MSRRRRRLITAGSYESLDLIELEGGEYNILLEGETGSIVQEGAPSSQEDEEEN